MKKLFKSVFALAIMGLALVSCNKADEAIPQDPEKGYIYTFSVVDDVLSTKATLGTTGVAWENGDRVGLFVPNYAGYASVDMTKTPKEVILYSKEIIPSGSKAYAYYPYSADNTKDDDESAKIVFNSVQQGGGVSAMPMAGIPFTVENEIAARTNQNGVIKFLNLGSIIEFNVFSTNPEYQTETIKSIKLESMGGDYISGVSYLDLTAVDPSDETTLEVGFIHSDEGSSEVKVNQDANVAADKDNATPIYMVLVPGVHMGVITVNTDQASYTWNYPEMTFKRNGLKHFNMDLNNADRGSLEEVVKTLPYEEPLSANFGDFTINNVTLSGLSDVWTIDSHGCSKATGYVSSTNHETESWLISPWIDLTGGVQYASFTFDHCYRYVTDHAGLSVMVLSDDKSADWEEVTVPNWVTNSNWTFGTSGEISLNSYIGKKVKVAFKYTSTSTGGATWEVKNFKAFVADEPQVATPVISFEPSTKTVTITCATPGAQIAYRLGGEDPVVDKTGPVAPTQGYTGPFTITSTTTVKALAGGVSGYRNSEIASQECVVGYAFETIAQLNALKTTTPTEHFGKLTHAVVSFVPSDGKSAVIKDATGSVLYFLNGGGMALKQGQTFTGEVTVKLTTYNKCSEITEMNATFIGEETSVNPDVVTLANLVGNLETYQNAYVKVENLEVTAVSTDGKNLTVTDDGKTNTYVVYTSYGTSGAVVGDKVTAIGTIANFSSKDQIKVWKAADITISHTVTTHKVYINQPTDGSGSIVVTTTEPKTISSGDDVMENMGVQIQAIANNGYKFGSWNVTGISATDPSFDATDPTTAFIMGSSDVTIEANFVSTSSTVLIMTMSDYVTANKCTVSAGTSVTLYTSLALNSDVTMSTSGAANCGSFWGTSPNIDWRLYQAKSGDVTISVSAGHALKSVKFTYTVSNTGTLMDGTTTIASGTKVSLSGTSKTFTVGNTGNKTNGQVKITAVEVEYE